MSSRLPNGFTSTRRDNSSDSDPRRHIKPRKPTHPAASSHVPEPSTNKKRRHSHPSSCSPPVTSYPPAPSIKTGPNHSSRSASLVTHKKGMQPSGIVKAIPVSGSMQLPEIPLKVGTATWELLFSNLMNWLPELEGISDENSVMLQYKADKGWRPLAGNDQLKIVLNEFGRLGWPLYVRCAPEEEFQSSSEKCEDEEDISKSQKQRSGELVRVGREEKNVRQRPSAAALSVVV